ncbi:D-cysteine desulfhydrase family protein [Xinfangfangia sp. CPCC 101601]|uniref:D-cysteine desulfhydrase family protein n=1 Tax=Pseudogemmobacter lacusdianii TaxID=3069608 RepID=A0ABU0VTR6_9RHOB|nr:D-cysteine desulfhydrase family protein [Xinfangfangia sp. CPCC 101601]MDQ2065122.1 D-cysteine desulfhydrase family protein [Xinfangfangia sp. CPCC 101601]
MIPNRPRVRLTNGPTPLEHLPRLSAHLGGPRILMKRDDSQSLGLGGNKIRKLEFHLGAALAAGATEVITTGALQSNHARLTAAACAKLGLNCHLILKPAVPRDNVAYTANGNLVLNALAGAQVTWVEAKADSLAEMHALSTRLEAQGRKVWIVPMGGSDALGSLGYVVAADEILDQTASEGSPSAVVVASGSGGTHAGLLAGLTQRGFAGSLEGACVYETAQGQLGKVQRLTAETLALLDPDTPLPAGAVRCCDSQLGPAYGIPTQAMHEALSLVARLEGIYLDPVYSGKAMAWLIANIAKWSRDETVVFVHTGGSPALFAYPEIFLG